MGFGIALAMAIFLVTGQALAARYYDVSVTNLTSGETFTPILVATHSRHLTIFTLGEAASDELARLAEGGDTVPLADFLAPLREVGDITDSGAPLPPGETVTIRVERGKGPNFYLSLAAMLVPTNDGFIALNRVPLPRGRKAVEYFSPVYDAGSELNDESCINVPGGGVCTGQGGEGYSPNLDGEGYVHIHAGIHGIADLAEEVYDWRNPAARIVIQAVAR
jgi:hypothetical protein